MDLAAQIASLKNDFGADKGPNAAATFDVELWMGHPDNGGAEVTATTDVEDEDTSAVTTVANGYVAPNIANDGTNFPDPAADTGILSTPAVEWPVSTAEYPGTVTHWVLRDPATSAIWHVGALADDDVLDVDDAGVTPRLALSIFYNPTQFAGLSL